ncbi:MAG: hypothetical protein EPO61_06005 [Nitrospirae bacterium]|nr:MAG: hypothetical protein EPO61_06005 [Nitrospirota bacterium]
MVKPIFKVDIAPNAQSSLEAHSLLAAMMDETFFKQVSNLRPPMGIYNVSVSRVCDRVIRFCTRLEQYFRASGTVTPSKANDDVMQELIDYIESAFYAAAEHVDDIDSIATAFLARSNAGTKEADYRNLQSGIKKHKRLVSAAANAIKHQQSRIRIFSTEFAYSGVSGCLHGYFIEGVEDGVICPSTTFHHTYPVLSATALAWEIVMFVLNCSRDLSQFLKAVSPASIEAKDIQCEVLGKAVIAAARLPNYTFGEEHPFARATLRLTNAAPNRKLLDSNLYGSILIGWPQNGAPEFGSSTSGYAGDGVSKSFRIVHPKSVTFHQWD